MASSMPQYTSSDGRLLTEEERQLLIENTQRLIQQFESEYQAELARNATLTHCRQDPVPTQPTKPADVSSPSAQKVLEAEAKQIVRSKYGVDPELPGWRGLVLTEMERINRVD